MKGLGYGKGYQYAHDLEGKVADMDCLPEALKGRRYFEAQDIGAESEIRRRLEDVEKKRKADP
jgi:putative ATPase